MPGRSQSVTFKIYVLVVCTAWAAVPVAALWGLDWRWIPTTFLIAVVALLLGGLIEIQLDKRAEDREADEARRDYLAAEEEHWLAGKDQPR